MRLLTEDVITAWHQEMILRRALSTLSPKGVRFFFQAEDGIRDTSVTGVQTCALPISTPPRPTRRPCSGSRPSRPRAASIRSEERRVGKEGRSRWSTNHLKKRERDSKSGGTRRRLGKQGRKPWFNCMDIATSYMRTTEG